VVVKIFLLSGCWVWGCGSARGSFLGLCESVTLAIGLDDVDPVGEAVEQSAGGGPIIQVWQ